MPGFDRTGPQGMGPMTGGARGRCNSSGTGIAAGGYGYGRGMANGRNFRGDFMSGRGMRRGFTAGCYPRSVPASIYSEASSGELNMLKAQAEDMRGALEEISRRISELEKKSE